MPEFGKQSADSADHESGEGSHDSARTNSAKPKAKFDAGNKSRYNPATHTMRTKSDGYANKKSEVRPLTSQEHRQAAGALHQAGHTHAAAHHMAAAEAMEQEAPQAGTGPASMANGMYGNKVAGSRPQLSKRPGVQKPAGQTPFSAQGGV